MTGTAVLAALRDGPVFVAEIVAATGRSTSAIYNDLHELQWAGLVTAQPYGPDRLRGRAGRPRNVYALASYVPPPPDELVDDLFALHVA